MTTCVPQLSLAFRQRGGARKGAGRKCTGRAKVPHSTRPELSRQHPIHVTLRIASGLASLRGKRCFLVVRRALGAGRETRGFRLVHFSVLSNHLHLVVEAHGKAALARGVKGLQVRIARALNRLLLRRGRVFGDRYHAHVLKTPREVRHAIAYVLLNARKHARRVEPTRRADPCSSARHFDGWMGAVRCSILDPAIPVAAAQTWLLRVGWRRHGLISPSEILC